MVSSTLVVNIVTHYCDIKISRITMHGYFSHWRQIRTMYNVYPKFTVWGNVVSP